MRSGGVLGVDQAAGKPKHSRVLGRAELFDQQQRAVVDRDDHHDAQRREPMRVFPAVAINQLQERAAVQCPWTVGYVSRCLDGIAASVHPTAASPESDEIPSLIQPPRRLVEAHIATVADDA